jgi:hypothetical protein
LWNEPNVPAFFSSPTPAKDYAKLVKAAYPAIKAADPSLRVLAGAMSGPDVRFLEDLLRAGGDRFDALSLHLYDAPAALGEEVKDIQKVLTEHGLRPDVWITEFGYSTCALRAAECVSPARQATDLRRAFRSLTEVPHVSAVIAYTLSDTGTEPDSINDHFGVVTSDLRRKPSFDAVKTALADLPARTPSP